MTGSSNEYKVGYGRPPPKRNGRKGKVAIHANIGGNDKKALQRSSIACCWRLSNCP